MNVWCGFRPLSATLRVTQPQTELVCLHSYYYRTGNVCSRRAQVVNVITMHLTPGLLCAFKRRPHSNISFRKNSSDVLAHISTTPPIRDLPSRRRCRGSTVVPLWTLFNHQRIIPHHSSHCEHHWACGVSVHKAISWVWLRHSGVVSQSQRICSWWPGDGSIWIIWRSCEPLSSGYELKRCACKNPVTDGAFNRPSVFIDLFQCRYFTQRPY